MPAIEVLVRNVPAPSPTEESRSGLLDFIVDGINVTARLGQGAALALLAELSGGVVAISRGKRDRFTASFYSGDEAWEIGLETDGPAVLLSVYRTAPSTVVAVHERRMDLGALRQALLGAIDRTADAPGRGPTALTAARSALATPGPSYGRRPLDRVALSVSTPSDQPVAIRAQARFRAPVGTAVAVGDEPHVERSDLSALLAKGSVTVVAGEAELHVGSTFPFLLAEQLLAFAEEAVRAEREQRALFRRAEVDTVKLSLRSTPAEPGLVLRIRNEGGEGRDVGAALAGLEIDAFAHAAAKFALALEAAFSSSDPTQHANLRLQHLTRSARALEQELCQNVADDSLRNPDPDSYRS
ncbi:MAG TPA: hypothetical protein VGQ57_21815, partial [Polyangiaceae bacterium]|nr:hypothetical protein [Polyangiaceae bacterium]